MQHLLLYLQVKGIFLIMVILLTCTIFKITSLLHIFSTFLLYIPGILVFFNKSQHYVTDYIVIGLFSNMSMPYDYTVEVSITIGKNTEGALHVCVSK